MLGIHRRFLHDFSILTALFNTIVLHVLDMTREHHSVIKMSLPRSQQRGLFFSAAALSLHILNFLYSCFTMPEV